MKSMKSHWADVPRVY